MKIKQIYSMDDISIGHYLLFDYNLDLVSLVKMYLGFPAEFRYA
jgi:hypothetical protein